MAKAQPPFDAAEAEYEAWARGEYEVVVGDLHDTALVWGWALQFHEERARVEAEMVQALGLLPRPVPVITVLPSRRTGLLPSEFPGPVVELGGVSGRPNGWRLALDDLHVEIPAERLQQAAKVAEVMGDEVYSKFPFLDGMVPMSDDLTELVLNRTWRPALSITGADGIPPLASAGNVLRPQTSVKLSLRLPPTLDGKRAGELLKEALLRDPPNGAQVTLDLEKASTGWNAPALAPWLERAIGAASEEFFGAPAMYMGEGGSIPFMGMLGEKFPGAQFMITGVLGPHSNAHGPNEFLHIPMGKRVTACVSKVLFDHHAASLRGETSGSPVAADSGTRHGGHGCC